MFWLLLGVVACNTETSVTKEQRRLAVSPSLVDLGDFRVGEEVPGALTLTHLEGPEIRIIDLSLLNIAGDFFSVEEDDLPTVAPGEELALGFLYHPTEAGYHRAQLYLLTDEEQEAEHVVEIRASAAFPAADLFPSALDFGPVEVGTTTSRSLSLRNAGTVPLDLVGLSFSQPVYSSPQLPVRVEAGEQVEIQVDFTPTEEGAAAATLSLDLGSAPARSVELLGNDCENGESALYDQDADGYATCGGDCDDSRAEASPAGQERCDTLDNDCDGLVDEQTDCADDDGDGYTELEGDCADAEPTISPGATEDPTNGIDDDCDGTTDLGAADNDNDDYSGVAGDCDDTNATVFPGAPELVDGRDNDCDGTVDEGTSVYDDDGDGITEDAGDCNDSDAGISPLGRERADGLDNDCDGSVDEGTEAADDDGDGFTEQGGDCDDGDAAVNPAAVEQAGDGVDNNCDGLLT